MKMENYLLPHMSHPTTFLRPRPLLEAVVENFVFPFSLLVDASSIHRSLFKNYVCFASILPWPSLWLATEAIITPFCLSLSIEFHI